MQRRQKYGRLGSMLLSNFIDNRRSHLPPTETWCIRAAACIRRHFYDMTECCLQMLRILQRLHLYSSLPKQQCTLPQVLCNWTIFNTRHGQENLLETIGIFFRRDGDAQLTKPTHNVRRKSTVDNKILHTHRFAHDLRACYWIINNSCLNITSKISAERGRDITLLLHLTKTNSNITLFSNATTEDYSTHARTHACTPRTPIDLPGSLRWLEMTNTRALVLGLNIMKMPKDTAKLQTVYTVAACRRFARQIRFWQRTATCLFADTLHWRWPLRWHTMRSRVYIAVERPSVSVRRLSHRLTATTAVKVFAAERPAGRRYRSIAAGALWEPCCAGAGARATSNAGSVTFRADEGVSVLTCSLEDESERIMYYHYIKIRNIIYICNRPSC